MVPAPINGPDQFSIGNDFMTQRRIGIVQEFTRSEKRQLRAERFEREAQRSSAEKTALVASIQRETALAWLGKVLWKIHAPVLWDEFDLFRRIDIRSIASR